MSSEDASVPRRSVAEPPQQQEPEQPAERPPCCCESRCTCRHCHGGCHRGGPHRSGDRSARHGPTHRGRGPAHGGCADGGHRHSPNSARRCLSCVPEVAELGEADLLARQQHCEEARLEEMRRRAALADSFARHARHSGGGLRYYTSNTAEMLRRRNNAACQDAVDAEYNARRRELQAELAERREEIAALQRAREERRMEAALCASESAQRGGHHHHHHGGHRRSPSPWRHHGGRVSPPAPPALAPKGECPPTPPRPARHSRTPPPPHPHHGHDGWGWCPPPPPGPCGRRGPSPWQHTRRPPPPPPGGPVNHHHRHHHDCPPPPPCAWACPPSCQPGEGAAPHHSPCPPPAAAPCAACPSCGHALLSARDIVSMVAAGHLDAPVACTSCGFIGGTLRCPADRRQPPPHEAAAPQRSGGAVRDGSGQPGQPGDVAPRSRSAASSSSSPPSLSGPKFGHKVFITDDVYRDRRARYLAEWEASGAVRRVRPSSQRSPSAPLPERTPKWRTTGSGMLAD